MKIKKKKKQLLCVIILFSQVYFLYCHCYKKAFFDSNGYKISSKIVLQIFEKSSLLYPGLNANIMLKIEKDLKKSYINSELSK